MTQGNKIPQQSIDSSIKFQAECRERAEANMINMTNETESSRFKKTLLGVIIAGTSLCLAGTGIYFLAQNLK